MPLGLIYKIFYLALDGSRDLTNKSRFNDSIIDNGCCIDHFSSIGAHCHLMEKAFIAKSSISGYSYIGKNTVVQNAAIGSFCSIANDVCIGLGKHPIEYFSTSPLFFKKKNPLKVSLIDHELDFEEYKCIEIGSDVWIGARAIILDGLKIGNGAIIAANAVVTKDVPDYAIVGGCPAKILRYRFSPIKIAKMLESEWYQLKPSEIKSKIEYLNSI
jgi:acetyltransferase-like isoleucine patch superfamily enzyme